MVCSHERSGVINIALEGIMLTGALCGIGFIHIFNHSMPPQLLLLCAVLVAGAAGIVFSLFHAFAAIHMKADQVISGTALNTFAPAFCIFIARTFQQTQQIQFENVFRIESVLVLGSIPIIGDLLFKNTYITTYIGLFLVLAWAIIYKRALVCVFVPVESSLRLRILRVSVCTKCAMQAL